MARTRRTKPRKRTTRTTRKPKKAMARKTAGRPRRPSRKAPKGARRRRSPAKVAATPRAPKVAENRRTTKASSRRRVGASRQRLPTTPEGTIGEPARHREPEAKAFQLDSSEGVEPLAQELAEEYLENATGADDAPSEHREEPMTEEQGGPFVGTSAATEFADDTDEANPPDAEREALPRVLSQGSEDEAAGEEEGAEEE